MSERITRTQAEAAAKRQAVWAKDLAASVNVATLISVEEDARTVLAYLAQRPDEDTVRKGHEAWGEQERECRRVADLSAGLRTGSATRLRGIHAERLAAIRAAMYQPEEDTP